MTDLKPLAATLFGPHEPKPTERARCYGCGRFGKWTWDGRHSQWVASSSCQEYETAHYEDSYDGYWVCTVAVNDY